MAYEDEFSTYSGGEDYNEEPEDESNEEPEDKEFDDEFSED